jgi:hypothetical protein
MTKIEVIKQNVSMQDLLQHYTIHPQNKSFYLCPFHTEKTPSARVHNGKFHCFGCSTDLTVIDFVMKYENCNIHDAIKLISNWFGLGLDKELTDKEKQAYIKKRNNIKLQQIARQIVEAQEEKLINFLCEFDLKVQANPENITLQAKLLNLKRTMLLKCKAICYMDKANDTSILLYDLYEILPKEQQNYLIGKTKVLKKEINKYINDQKLIQIKKQAASKLLKDLENAGITEGLIEMYIMLIPGYLANELKNSTNT